MTEKLLDVSGVRATSQQQGSVSVPEIVPAYVWHMQQLRGGGLGSFSSQVLYLLIHFIQCLADDAL
jgi:hypothetical protein